MARSGVLKSKKAAQDGNRQQNDGTVEDTGSGETYAYTNQNIHGATVNGNVTFDVVTDPRGNSSAVNINPV
jgi:hypothetical protein